MIGNPNRAKCSAGPGCLEAPEHIDTGELTVLHFNHLFEPKEIPIFSVKFRLCPHQIQKSSGTLVAVLRPKVASVDIFLSELACWT